MCLTYGRVHLLEEAIHSFLQQDYAGEKELLILNDFGRQRLHFDHPQVRVVNVPHRFRTVGEKRNAAVKMCRYKLVAVWDDDDICLPHRLSDSAPYLENGQRLYQALTILRHSQSGFKRFTVGWAYMTAIWHWNLFHVVGGYPHLEAGEDKGLHDSFARVLGHRRFAAVPDDRIFYIYRRGAPHTYRLAGADQTGRHYLGIGAWVNAQVDAGRMPEGDVELRPRWTRDWTAAVRDWQHPAGSP